MSAVLAPCPPLLPWRRRETRWTGVYREVPSPPAALLPTGQDSGLGVNPCEFVRISRYWRAKAGTQKGKVASQIRLDSFASS